MGKCMQLMLNSRLWNVVLFYVFICMCRVKMCMEGGSQDALRKDDVILGL